MVVGLGPRVALASVEAKVVAVTLAERALVVIR